MRTEHRLVLVDRDSRSLPSTRNAASLRFEWVEDDRVVDGAGRALVVLAAGVAVGAAAFAGAWRGSAGPVWDQVAGLGQLAGEVVEGVGQSCRGERAARVTESRAASRARLKLIRPGSSPVGVAVWLISSRIAW